MNLLAKSVFVVAAGVYVFSVIQIVFASNELSRAKAMAEMGVAGLVAILALFGILATQA